MLDEPIREDIVCSTIKISMRIIPSPEWVEEEAGEHSFCCSSQVQVYHCKTTI